MLIGIHTPPQNAAIPELRRLWRRAEELGFGWISISDHLSSALAGPAAAATERFGHCHDAVATHALLATETRISRVGCLVYCAAYRPAFVIAQAAATIDHLSGGRAELGLGAGWVAREFEMTGIPFPSAGDRLDHLEEAAQCIRALLAGDEVTFRGRHVALERAALSPRPVHGSVPLWIGGHGERRTVRIVAQWADGWNLPFVSPDDVRRKRAVLERSCDEVGRDPAQIRIAVNVGLAWSDASLVDQYGPSAAEYRSNTLGLGDGDIAERLAAYAAAGADQVNVTIVFPFDLDDLERFAAAVNLAPAQPGRRPRSKS